MDPSQTELGNFDADSLAEDLAARLDSILDTIDSTHDEIASKLEPEPPPAIRSDQPIDDRTEAGDLAPADKVSSEPAADPAAAVSASPAIAIEGVAAEPEQPATPPPTPADSSVADEVAAEPVAAEQTVENVPATSDAPTSIAAVEAVPTSPPEVADGIAQPPADDGSADDAPPANTALPAAGASNESKPAASPPPDNITSVDDQLARLTDAMLADESAPEVAPEMAPQSAAAAVAAPAVGETLRPEPAPAPAATQPSSDAPTPPPPSIAQINPISAQAPALEVKPFPPDATNPAPSRAAKFARALSPIAARVSMVLSKPLAKLSKEHRQAATLLTSSTTLAAMVLWGVLLTRPNKLETAVARPFDFAGEPAPEVPVEHAPSGSKAGGDAQGAGPPDGHGKGAKKEQAASKKQPKKPPSKSTPKTAGKAGAKKKDEKPAGGH